MTSCKLISYSVPDGPPFYANGGFHAVTKCETHYWIDDGGLASIGGLCPIGQIEQAVEQGLERIRREINGQTLREGST